MQAKQKYLILHRLLMTFTQSSCRIMKDVSRPFIGTYVSNRWHLAVVPPEAFEGDKPPPQGCVHPNVSASLLFCSSITLAEFAAGL